MPFKQFRAEIDSILIRDPAAKSRLEVLLCYPGVHAVLFYRAAHWVWRRGWHTPARGISQVARFLTGIEIHPGAILGKRLFIDHGMGVVIGETAIIGDDVTLYQGVTLGGTALHDERRHPILEDNVIIGAGAQVLGNFTVGRGARIGANAVVVKPVPPGATVAGIPAKIAGAAKADFCAYGLTETDLPDPVARAIGGLLEEIAALKARIAELEESAPMRPAECSNPSPHFSAARDDLPRL